jgi:hypothetical protein
MMEKAMRAFVSYVRGYKEHHCTFIFRLQVGGAIKLTGGLESRNSSYCLVSSYFGDVLFVRMGFYGGFSCANGPCSIFQHVMTYEQDVCYATAVANAAGALVE